MNNVVIRIIDNDNNVLGDLDLVSFTDFPLALTKGIVNLDNLKARTGTYSKTFKVPSTKNNSDLLSNVDNINSRKDYRDALNRKPCVIIVNDSEIETGFVQVGKVMDGFELDSFELVFFGNNIDWVKGANELKLNEINYRNNAQVYDQSSIIAAQQGTIATYDHSYPYISRGGNDAPQTTIVRDYFPCFYIAGIVERGLNQLGWNLSSSFFTTDDIKQLMGDLNGKMQVTQAVIDESKTRAEKTDGSQTLFGGSDLLVKFNDDSTPPNEDSNNNYDTGFGTYTIPSNGRYDVTVSLNTGNWAENNSAVNVNVRMCVGTGTSLGVDTFAIDSQFKSVSTTTDQTTTFDLSGVAAAGELLTIFVEYFPFTISLGQGDIENGSYFDVQRSSRLSNGDTFSLTDVIPSDFYLLDVINDVTRMFNLYYWSDVKTKTVYVEPRDTFFKSPTTAINWTDKLDINKKYEVDYISSYKRRISFSYNDLDNDEWLINWQRANKRTYGQYTHTLPNRFGEGTTEIKLDMFCAPYAHIATEATPIVGSSFNSNIAFTTLKVWNEYLPVGQIPLERIDGYNPKIFFYQYGEQLALNGSNRLIGLGIFNSTDIPYGIFETYNNTVSPQNLSFTGDDGLFSSHYSNMMKNIEEGGRLVAYFNLSNVDIENLDFRNLVYIDYPSKVKGYYLIESVIDYNPIRNGLTKVSLFKFENLGSVPIDDSQQGNNNSDTDNGNSPDTIEPIYIEDGSGILIPVFSEDPVTLLIEPVFR